MRFRPCIDLHQGKVKQIVGSSLQGNAVKENFSSDKGPDEYAKLYQRDGLTGGHVIMLGPDNNEAALLALNAFPGGIQIGGGIHLENAQTFLNAGASHVIVTSYIFSNGKIEWEKLSELTQTIGAEQLVLDLSCKKTKEGYFIATNRWQKITKEKIEAPLLDKLKPYCQEFLIHAVDVEGKQSGVDEQLIQLLSECQHPMVYAGGISSYEDLELIQEKSQGRMDYTVGSALDIFGGKKIQYQKLIERYHHKEQI